MKKLANVIKVDKKLINDIAKKVLSVLDLYSDYLQENPDEEILVAQYHFADGNNKNTVDICIKHSNGKTNIGEYSYSKYNPTIYLFSDKIGEDVWEISQFLLHEITHFIDFQYNPLYRATIDLNDDFFNSFKYIIYHGDGFVNFIAPNGEYSIEDIAKLYLQKIIKSDKFKNLIKKYNIVLDRNLKRKLLNIIIGYYIDLSGQLMYDPKYHNIGAKKYYNSDAELKAFTNEIVNEVIDILKESNIDYYDNPLDLLLISKTYSDIEKYLFPKNKKKILYETGKAIIQYSSDLNRDSILEKYIKNLDSKEHLMFRYLNKLYNEHIEKFEQLIKDKDFVAKNKKLINYVIKMNFEKKKLNSLARKMQEMVA